MSSPSEDVGPAVLREWGLPDPGESKKSRGRVMIVGGSRRSPGAMLLAGEAALRVGSGRLGMVVPRTIADPLALALPEAAVFALPSRSGEALESGVHDELRDADAVLVGPGFDDVDETRATLIAIADIPVHTLVLDAYAIGVLPTLERGRLPDRLLLNLNLEEAAILLGHELGPDRILDLAEIAREYHAMVNCYGSVVAPDGRAWQVHEGGPGLATSGSGDVLAGAITGFAARGLELERAAVWGSWTHARAGDRLTRDPGLGFLARDLLPELTRSMNAALRAE